MGPLTVCQMCWKNHPGGSGASGASSLFQRVTAAVSSGAGGNGGSVSSTGSVVDFPLAAMPESSEGRAVRLLERLLVNGGAGVSVLREWMHFEHSQMVGMTGQGGSVACLRAWR